MCAERTADHGGTADALGPCADDHQAADDGHAADDRHADHHGQADHHRQADHRTQTAGLNRAGASGRSGGPAVIDGGWPRTYALATGGSVLVYQPQIASWEKQAHMVAFSAVSHLPKGGTKTEIGTIKIEANTKVSVPERLVSFEGMKIVESNFQTLSRDQLRQLTADMEIAIPTHDRVIALDRVLASVDKSAIVPKNIEGVKAEPPVIYFSKRPAVMVNLDGEAIWSPIRDNDLKFAVNTNWDLFQHAPTATLYLRHDTSWLQATDVKGPWTASRQAPAELQQVARRRELEGRQGERAGQDPAAQRITKGLREPEPAELSC